MLEPKEQIDLLLRHFGVKKIKELSEIIDIPANYISGWKSRGIPTKNKIEICKKVGKHVSWLETGRDQPPVKEYRKYELNQDLMAMIYECFDRYEEQHGKLSALDKARISSSIYRELGGQDTTLEEIQRSIRLLVGYNR